MIEYDEELDQYSVDNEGDTEKVLVEDYSWELAIATAWLACDSD